MHYFGLEQHDSIPHAGYRWVDQESLEKTRIRKCFPDWAPLNWTRYAVKQYQAGGSKFRQTVSLFYKQEGKLMHPYSLKFEQHVLTWAVCILSYILVTREKTSVLLSIPLSEKHRAQILNGAHRQGCSLVTTYLWAINPIVAKVLAEALTNSSIGCLNFIHGMIRSQKLYFKSFNTQYII